ncbi:energy-coupling factor ABC transporter permease [Paracoccus sp. MBLB3053]|uniref:Energy-coupling factor ABC transporter permease n=1 Tax=Paracoccus aurantius TaxID=3073814 RepID=A0ABU2HT79_9RHOB|nr:energy-coupling factor ABC transporter permease [Paracoccus sp. MBLB3053]MDS9468248.1 energy-coupling factor ABC transporter permease [Paracoccus sp. MBLB3053]
MHIEPGIVDSAKMVFAYATAAGAAAYTARIASKDIGLHGAASLFVRSLTAGAATFVFFEVLPHFPVGVSEVHFILGTTLFLILGAAPAALGLALGLLVQGMFFAPTDLPMYFVNLTTLLVPLFAIEQLARRVIPMDTAYVDLKYADVLKLSLAYQGGVVAWVAFWAIYGQGFGIENLSSVASFGVAYMLVVLVEPIADLIALAAAKAMRPTAPNRWVAQRLYTA